MYLSDQENLKDFVRKFIKKKVIFKYSIGYSSKGDIFKKRNEEGKAK